MDDRSKAFTTMTVRANPTSTTTTEPTVSGHRLNDLIAKGDLIERCHPLLAIK
jgi:hypothetical protein